MMKPKRMVKLYGADGIEGMLFKKLVDQVAEVLDNHEAGTSFALGNNPNYFISDLQALLTGTIKFNDDEITAMHRGSVRAVINLLEQEKIDGIF